MDGRKVLLRISHGPHSCYLCICVCASVAHGRKSKSLCKHYMLLLFTGICVISHFCVCCHWQMSTLTTCNFNANTVLHHNRTNKTPSLMCRELCVLYMHIYCHGLRSIHFRLFFFFPFFLVHSVLLPLPLQVNCGNLIFILCSLSIVVASHTRVHTRAPLLCHKVLLRLNRKLTIGYSSQLLLRRMQIVSHS